MHDGNCLVCQLLRPRPSCCFGVRLMCRVVLCCAVCTCACAQAAPQHSTARCSLTPAGLPASLHLIPPPLQAGAPSAPAELTTPTMDCSRLGLGLGTGLAPLTPAAAATGLEQQAGGLESPSKHAGPRCAFECWRRRSYLGPVGRPHPSPAAAEVECAHVWWCAAAGWRPAGASSGGAALALAPLPAPHPPTHTHP